jgi:hypothetical protein
VGQALCYYVLTEQGKPIVRSTIQALSDNEKKTESIQVRVKELNKNIIDRIGEMFHMNYKMNMTHMNQLKRKQIIKKLMTLLLKPTMP